MCALALGDVQGAKDVAKSLHTNHSSVLHEPIVKQVECLAFSFWRSAFER